MKEPIFFTGNMNAKFKKKSDLLFPECRKKAMKNIDHFFWFIYERQMIWHRRNILKQNQPWTNNKIFKTYKYENSFRHLDYCSQWLIKNIFDAGISSKEQLWQMVVFRMFNKPETFERLGYIPTYKKWNKREFYKDIEKIKKHFGRVFHTSYTVSPPKGKEEIKNGLEWFYVNNINEFYNILDSVYYIVLNAKKPIDIIKSFNRIPTVGNFISYIFYTDLCETDWFNFNENDYFDVGNGCLRGTKMIFPESNTKSKAYMRVCELTEIAQTFYKKNKIAFPYPYDKRKKKIRCLTRAQIEHCLCAWFKYIKTTTGLGKKQPKYIARVNKKNEQYVLF